MNIAGLAIDRRAIPVQITRRAAGAYNADGEFIEGASSTDTIRAAIQPASGRQLMDLPEGIRTEARWLLWSRSDLSLDDRITAQGLTYRIMFVWPRLDGGFTRAALGLLA